jgi:long-chain acyl-CoA synthetase
MPGTDARIIDLITGESLPPGQIGELSIKGPQIMLGYLGKSADERPFSTDGWLLTGDIARMDEDGYFQIISRR